MTTLEIFEIIFVIIPMPVWIIMFSGLIGLIVLEIKERNDKNGEKIKGKKVI